MGESLDADVSRQVLKAIGRLVEAVRLRPQVEAVLPFEQVREALKRVASGHRGQNRTPDWELAVGAPVLRWRLISRRSGSGGTIFGVGQCCRGRNAHCRVVVVERNKCCTLTRREIAFYLIEGIGDGSCWIFSVDTVLWSKTLVNSSKPPADRTSSTPICGPAFGCGADILCCGPLRGDQRHLEEWPTDVACSACDGHGHSLVPRGVGVVIPDLSRGRDYPDIAWGREREQLVEKAG